MADLNYTIGKVLGDINDPSGKGKWNKSVMYVSWFDRPETLDIRDVNISDNRIGKGVCLSNEETDRLVDLLLANDFGSIDEIEKHLKRRKEIFTINKDDIDNVFDFDEKIIIDIDI